MKRKVWTGVVLCIGILFLIFDAKYALQGAQDGITLCIRSVIPALLPFFFLSTLLNSELTGHNIRILRPLGRLCKVPEGAESILLLGLLGGYPVGAQCIYQAYRDGKLSKTSAHRMLGFCNNAGPAFIFGMMGTVFRSVWIPWVLWLIHILSALFVGIILPGKPEKECILSRSGTMTVSQAMEKSLKNMAVVCGWVIVFRVMIQILNRWVLWLAPDALRITVIGLLELSNGALSLADITSPGTAFLIGNVLLGFGGLCVHMQTVSVTRELQTGMYFPGKIIQCLFSLLCAYMVQPVLFPETEQILLTPALYVTPFIVICAIMLVIRKKSYSNSREYVV